MLTGLSQSVPAPDRVKPAVLPTTIGLIVALAGPFLVQFVLAPLILQSRVNPSTAVLLSQGTLILLAATVIAITRWWERKPWSWLGLRPISWRAVLLAAVLGVVLGVAVPVLTMGVNRLMPPSNGARWRAWRAAGRPGCS